MYRWVLNKKASWEFPYVCTIHTVPLLTDWEGLGCLSQSASRAASAQTPACSPRLHTNPSFSCPEDKWHINTGSWLIQSAIIYSNTIDTNLFNLITQSETPPPADSHRPAWPAIKPSAEAFSVGATQEQRYTWNMLHNDVCETCCGPYVSLLSICADLPLQTRGHFFVRVVRNHSHQLHTALNLCGTKQDVNKWPILSLDPHPMRSRKARCWTKTQSVACCMRNLCDMKQIVYIQQCSANKSDTKRAFNSHEGGVRWNVIYSPPPSGSMHTWPCWKECVLQVNSSAQDN